MRSPRSFLQDGLLPHTFLEPVALAPLHLGDVLEQVSHPDGGLKLVSGIVYLHGVAGSVG